MTRRTLDDILKRAREELRINPTITVYTFDNGVEQRRPANPWAKFNDALSRVNIDLTEMKEAFKRVSETAKHMKLPEVDNWADDESRRRERDEQ